MAGYATPSPTPQPPTAQSQELHLLFLENPDISLTQSPVNPATSFPPPPPNLQQSTPTPRSSEALTQPRAGLSDLPLSNPDLTLFGHRKASYVIVTLQQTLETAFIPLHLTHTARGSHECLLLLLHVCSCLTQGGMRPNFPTHQMRGHLPGQDWQAAALGTRWQPNYWKIHRGTTSPDSRGPWSSMTSINVRCWVPLRSALAALPLLLLLPALGNLHPSPPAYVWRFKVRETYDQDSTQVTRQRNPDRCNRDVNTYGGCRWSGCVIHDAYNEVRSGPFFWKDGTSNIRVQDP
ncbi:hypothetical protein QTO34_006447 [Cnephaeus nilssonii]|uniref:Uncharacterized protein n=1 Tax=Cnephaeus nilssonii TaxID=3371016 RepID=A0AA40HLR2_CNENI|nr:hypothetical protein QTO34_006447 [Eptesicus nilssonii]